MSMTSPARPASSDARRSAIPPFSIARLMAGKKRAKTGWLTSAADMGGSGPLLSRLCGRVGGAWLQQAAEFGDAELQRTGAAQDPAGDVRVPAGPVPRCARSREEVDVSAAAVGGRAA